MNVVAGYPGTPSTEVIETIAKRRPEGVHVEWSVNEKSPMEVGAGAAYAGARVLVTMKQVGLSVASDPLMSLEYVGVKGGMVVMVADDPGPISSQIEQDTRTFARFSVPVLDPCSVSEALRYGGRGLRALRAAGEPRLSPRHHAHRPSRQWTWRMPRRCHEPDGFERDPKRWVIFPALSVRNDAAIEQRNARLADELSDYPRNQVIEPVSGTRLRLGIVSHGINWQYVLENVEEGDSAHAPRAFPERLALDFLDGLDEVLCVEELDPVIERSLIETCGRNHLNVRIRGKLTGDVKPSGENSVGYVGGVVSAFLGRETRPPRAAPSRKPLPRSSPCGLPCSEPAARTAPASTT